MELLTGRLALRRPVPGDSGAIHTIHRDERACAHNPGDLLASRAEAEQLYARWDEHWQRHAFGYWVVRRRGADEPLGFCGLKFMPLDDRTVLNLFYRLDPSAWGGGVATEAASAVTAWAAEHRPEYLVVARVRPANTASARVALRAGLCRAEHLDCHGEDGLDHIYTSDPQAAASATASARESTTGTPAADRAALA